MKWILVFGFIAAYLAGLQCLEKLALSQLKQIETAYTQVSNNPNLANNF